MIVTEEEEENTNDHGHHEHNDVDIGDDDAEGVPETHPLHLQAAPSPFLQDQHSQSPENSFPTSITATFQNHNIDLIFAA